VQRRAFIGTLTAGLLAAPLVVEAQKTGKVWRIGWLSPAADRNNPIEDAFYRSMQGLGYIEGRNLLVERRYTAGRPDQWAGAAADIVRLNVDLIVVWTPAGTVAVKNATSSIPVVFLAGGAAVESGLVASLPRPDGNVTGVTFQAQGSLVPKYFELLKELVPKLSFAAMFRSPEDENAPETAKSEAIAKALGIRLLTFRLHGPGELHEAFATIKQEKPQALIANPGGLLYALRREIIEFAATNRLPAVYGFRGVVVDGGLMSLSPSLSDIAVRGAYYVDRILKGAKPADLPVEQPTKFELVINLKTAKALGLTIPPSLLQRADQVIDP
jgi:putative tryptophan/tyrosine transport system substrate-binding protein